MTLDQCMKSSHDIYSYSTVEAYVLVGENFLPRFILYKSFSSKFDTQISTFIYNEKLKLFIQQIRSDNNLAYKEHPIVFESNKWTYHTNCRFYIDNTFNKTIIENEPIAYSKYEYLQSKIKEVKVIHDDIL